MWTDERTEQLKALCLKDLSSSQIGAELGVTRNAVIGRCARLGIDLYRSHGQRGPGTKPRRTEGRRSSRLSLNAMLMRRAERALHQDEATDLPPDQSPCAVKHIDAELTQCRWPLNEPTADMLVCGAKVVEGFSYCARHCRIAYQPPSVRRAA